MRTWLPAVLSLACLACIAVAGPAAADPPDGASALRAARSTPDGASALRAARSTPDGASAPGAARSTPDDADALYRLAEAEDAAGDYEHASAHYRASVARLPSFRYAPKAITRATLLEAHSEGGWAPFARLESVRRDPKAADDPAAIDSLAHAIDAFPPGPTRGEAWMVCAEAYVARLHRRADGEAALRRVISDAHADPLLRRQAASELVSALIDDGGLGEARAAALSLGSTLDPRLALRVEALIRRRRLHVASLVDLALFALLVAAALTRATRRGELAEVAVALRRSAPLGAVFAAYVALAGGALASGYESGNAAPFFAFGAALVLVTTGARAWAAAGSAARGARAARAVLCASAVLAAAFLVLEGINGQYLEGFHL